MFPVTVNFKSRSDAIDLQRLIERSADLCGGVASTKHDVLSTLHEAITAALRQQPPAEQSHSQKARAA